ncbi:hypothetical protein IJI76_03310 [Candidatus Saccharibacteria bacterium]|nr:hypothetical protein [Candidatus Saccharibacteria bacterium]
MAVVTIDTINYWAKMSCPAWNSSKHPNSLFSRLIGNKIHQVSRRHYRKLYRKAAEDWWMGTTGRQTIAQYKSGYHGVNTYPYPYCDNRFADWPESDNPKTYNLISDQSGCVIKYATSYVAWKIFEETGRWPQKRTAERLDAKRWKQFLSEAGYMATTRQLLSGHHYVGVNPKKGEFGLVVWFEGIDEDLPNHVKISTYYNHEHLFSSVVAHEYEWVIIN